MTVKELIKHLETFDPNLTVVCQRYSDIRMFDTDEVQLGYMVQSYPTSSWFRFLTPEEALSYDKPSELKQVVHFEGN